MPRLRMSVPSPALVIACVALLASLSGTAVALPGKSTIDRNDFQVGVVRSKAIGNGGIATVDLKDGIIVPSKLAPSSVRSFAIAAGQVTNSDLGTRAVTASKLGPNAVGAAAIADGAVAQPEIATNGVGGGEVAADAIGTDEIQTNGVRDPEIAPNAVSADEIADNAVGASELAAGGVGASELGGLTVRTDSTPTPIGPAPAAGGSEAGCAPGEVAIGGGATWSDETADVQLVSERFLTDANGRPNGIEVRGRLASGAGPVNLTAQVLCLG